MSTLSLKGRVAIVTGAGGGLGRAYALELAGSGARVVVNDLGPSAKAVVDEIVAAGGEASVSNDSVATPEGGEAIVATAIEAFGQVDIVVNNAGILRDKTFGKIDWDDFDTVHAVHLRGSAYVSQPAYRLMKEQRYGRFIFISSNAGTFGNFGQSAYGSAKAGIIGLSNTIAIEGARAGILSNVVCPIALTQMTESSILAKSNAFDPGHVAPLVAFLASEACTETHAVFSAGAGRFARVFTGLSSGWSVPPGTRATAADIESHLSEILHVDGFSMPMSAPEETAGLAEDIAAQENAASAPGS